MDGGSITEEEAFIQLTRVSQNTNSCSPQNHHALRRIRGWTADRYRLWLERTLTQQVLG